jgi:hypothetical protein
MNTPFRFSLKLYLLLFPTAHPYLHFSPV